VAAVVLDTSVLIALFKSDDPHHSAAVQATSVRNEFRMSSRFGHEQRILISKVFQKIISVDEDIAVLGSQIRAERNLSLPDALISATAQKFKAQLWSCDRELVRVHRGAVLI
jgi:predicted nucleic acid-binding protein